MAFAAMFFYKAKLATAARHKEPTKKIKRLRSKYNTIQIIANLLQKSHTSFTCYIYRPFFSCQLKQ